MKFNILIDKYRHNSGGVRALHVLKDELNSRGYDAAMSYERPPALDDIHIWPEIVRGDPPELNVVHWALNTPPGNDFLQYRHWWAWEEGIMPAGTPLLTVNIIEMDLFRDPGLERSGAVGYVGKGAIPTVWPEPIGALITSTWPPTRAEVAGLLQRASVLYTADPYTALIGEAALAGCPVSVLGDPGWKRQHITAGVTYEGDLETARAFIGMARVEYVAHFNLWRQRVDHFVNWCAATFRPEEPASPACTRSEPSASDGTDSGPSADS